MSLDRIGNAALDSSYWEAKAAEHSLDPGEPRLSDEWRAAQGIFWWGLASLALWALVALLLLAVF